MHILGNKYKVATNYGRRFNSRPLNGGMHMYITLQDLLQYTVAITSVLTIVIMLIKRD